MLTIMFVGPSYGFDGQVQELLNQSVPIHTDGCCYRSVLVHIERQTTTKFIYNSRNIGADRPVTIHVNKVRLEDALEQLLKPLNLYDQL